MGLFSKKKKEEPKLWSVINQFEQKEVTTIKTLLNDVFKWHKEKEFKIKESNIDALIEKLEEFRTVKYEIHKTP